MATSTAAFPLRTPLTIRGTRAFFAPVNRSQRQATIFDPAVSANFNLEAPPAPWVPLGFVDAFSRSSETKIEAVMTGVPAVTSGQVRATLGATVSLRFLHWSKLAMALSASSEHWNVLASQPGGAAIGSGGTALTATPLLAGSSGTELIVPNASNFSVGAIVAVDVDYTGQLGYLGSAVSGAYVQSTSQASNDVDQVRRLTYNVGRVQAIVGNTLQLMNPLLAGVPTSAMKVQQVVAFTDREGGSFFQEWSALFVVQGDQGDRLLFHYPRLQSASAAAETPLSFSPTLGIVELAASFHALPIVDGNDQQPTLCYRTYVPAPNRAI